jgi:uncharacterized membrane protein
MLRDRYARVSTRTRCRRGPFEVTARRDLRWGAAKEKVEKVTAEVLDKFAELITVALGLVAALAWNTAIQNLFTMIFGKAGSALIGQFVYAIIITLVVIFATITVSRAAERARLTEERRRLEERTP